MEIKPRYAKYIPQLTVKRCSLTKIFFTVTCGTYFVNLKLLDVSSNPAVDRIDVIKTLFRR